MPGRTWVCGPSPDVLRVRWNRLIEAAPEHRPALLSEHPTDRTVRTVLRDNLPGYPARTRSLAEEKGPCPPPERIGYRSFDRQWIIPDKRLINRPNPSLWAARSRWQVCLTAPHDRTPSDGPAVTLTGLIPDLHHYHGRGGRVFPLWRDPDGAEPNVAPGLLDDLTRRCGAPVTRPDVLAYLAAVLAHPGFTARFAGDLVQPGLRVPLTADTQLFAEAVDAGRRVVWLHTYGQRFADPAAGRPARPPKLPADRRPKVREAIPDTPEGMPDEIAYDPHTQQLRVGVGVVAPVPPGVWEYEVSGMRVVRKWFGYRKRDPEGRRSSPLDEVNAAWWEPEFTTELLELLNVLALLVDLEPTQQDLLDRVLAAPLVTVGDLEAAGVLPVDSAARRPPRVAASGDAGLLQGT
ncbi:MAG: hypothetical protein M3N17_09020 [Actinomycetota bacterium]|nr:hypothetical protein [Actinomycetota bacterium]